MPILNRDLSRPAKIPCVVVIEACAEHMPAFRDLNFQWIDEHFEREPKDVAMLKDPVRFIVEVGGQIFAALRDHDIVGVCAVIPIGDCEYELVKMAVKTEARGLGAGRALMQAAEAWCARHGAKRIEIITNSVLEPAVRLYEKSGYALIHSGPHASYKRADRIFEKYLLSK